jgi:sulfur relay (sulfurtransferase) complex TusBCD TusD component (DsrE family)
MTGYVLIESRDPFESSDVINQYKLAADLARSGSPVTLFLVENGVLPARRCSQSSHLTGVSKAGVQVLADSFSLRERGIADNRLVDGVEPSPLDVVIDRMAEGSKCFWH